MQRSFLTLVFSLLLLTSCRDIQKIVQDTESAILDEKNSYTALVAVAPNNDESMDSYNALREWSYDLKNVHNNISSIVSKLKSNQQVLAEYATEHESICSGIKQILSIKGLMVFYVPSWVVDEAKDIVKAVNKTLTNLKSSGKSLCPNLQTGSVELRINILKNQAEDLKRYCVNVFQNYVAAYGNKLTEKEKRDCIKYAEENCPHENINIIFLTSAVFSNGAGRACYQEDEHGFLRELSWMGNAISNSTKYTDRRNRRSRGY